MRDNSSTTAGNGKPAKPYPDFPLFPHANGQWCKKIRGQLHYFGRWHEPDTALAKYLAEKDALHAGHKPRPNPDAITVKALCNEFLNAKKALVETGELSPRTLGHYRYSADLLVQQFGKHRLVADLRQADFAELRQFMAKRWSVHRLVCTIQHIRGIFKFGYDAELLDKPMRFGPGFKRPSKKTLRLERAKKGPRLFSAEEIRQLLAIASRPMKAILLLAVNAGLGNSDCGQLPLFALDLEKGWLDYPRPKTGVPRKAKLWPETVAALKTYLITRPEPIDPADAGLVFITKYGNGWHKKIQDCPIAKEFKKLLKDLGIEKPKGCAFYSLRHVFRTVADETKDQPAVDLVMGHDNGSMATFYREGISDDRLEAVADYVRTWLFGGKGGAE